MSKSEVELESWDVLEDIKSVLHPASVLSDEDFNDLALRLYWFQYQNNGLYKRFVDSRLKTAPESWEGIPPLPIRLFKHSTPVVSFELDQRGAGLKNWTEFRSSGTTSEQKSTHYMMELEHYESSLASSFQNLVLGDLPWTPGYRVICLSPKLEHSSLYHMMKYLINELGDGQSGFWEDLDDWGVWALYRSLDHLDTPVILFGTSLAFLKILEADAHGRVGTEIGPLSRIIETGGAKGSNSKEFDDPQLFSWKVCQKFGLKWHQHWREYSMSELSSQLYSHSSNLSGEPHYRGPSWLRYQVIDPVSRTSVSPGEDGIICFYDLANVWSCAFIMTEDVGSIDESGALVLKGRARGALEKGCSLTVAQAMEAV